MTYGKVFFVAAALSPMLWANLRAPLRIDRGGAELKGESSALEVLGESLEFRCPESYTGKSDIALLESRTCDARVRYRIRAKDKERVRLTFIFAGSGNVTWRLGDRVTQSEPVKYKALKAADEIFEFEKGENELAILYKQALSFEESGHGYFSDGKWRQSLVYELWPIAEWQWTEGAAADISFGINARSGFLGIGYKNDKMGCSVSSGESETEVPLTLAKIENDRRIATGRVTLARKKQRLRCFFAAD